MKQGPERELGFDECQLGSFSDLMGVQRRGVSRGGEGAVIRKKGSSFIRLS
jgi:hypothetical protein